MIWKIDDSSSVIGFAVKHLMVSTVHGRFQKVNGMIEWDEENPANSCIEASVESSSLHTGDKSRDKHLRSTDFFDVQNYDTLTFKSNRIKEVGKNKYKLIGDLTIRNVAREVAFEVEYAGRASGSFAGNKSAFRANAIINRKDFGLGWNAAMEAGGMLVGDKVKIELQIMAVKEVAETVAA